MLFAIVLHNSTTILSVKIVNIIREKRKEEEEEEKRRKEERDKEIDRLDKFVEEELLSTVNEKK